MERPRLGVVGVHVPNRNVEPLREVARIAGRAPFHGVRREPDLVVRDQVQRAAGRIAGERLEIERLRDDTLSGEGCVAVDEDRERGARVMRDLRLFVVGLDGARLAFDDRVDVLEMARVRSEPDAHVARLRMAGPFGAEVVSRRRSAFGTRPPSCRSPSNSE
jgi:hypothetical protein